MNKRNITKLGTSVLKVAAVVTAFTQLPQLELVLGDKAAWAAIAFTGASVVKDVVLTILDAVDDGSLNGSFKNIGLWLLAACAFGFGLGGLASCTVAIGADGRPYVTIDPETVNAVVQEITDEINEELAPVAIPVEPTK